MAKYAQHLVSRRETPQTEIIPGQEDRQAKNNAGGVSYVIDDWARLDRFLILGNPGGTYYQTEQKLTRENAKCVLDCAAADFPRALNRVVEISKSGRAPKQSPAIFALALLSSCGSPEANKEALSRISDVCGVPTALFEFVEAVKSLRGMGHAVRKAIASWYLGKDLRTLAYQVTKYQQRNGWSNQDLLRLARPRVSDEGYSALFGYIVGKKPAEAIPAGEARNLVEAVEAVKTLQPGEVASHIRNHRLVREVIPTEHLNRADVWDALLQDMPLMAMIRNLGKMSAVGLLEPRSEAAREVCAALGDQEALRKARIHPFSVLLALSTYEAGRGVKGSLNWSPVPSVIDALDGAFYAAFGNVEPTGKRLLYALDVSGSMIAPIFNSHLTCREGAAALAMVAVATEADDVDVFGFADGSQGQWGSYDFGKQPGARGEKLMHIPFSKKMRLDAAVETAKRIPMGGTDCALPFIWAKEKKKHYDAVVVVTDNETWAGDIHPSQAMERYRQWAGHNVKEAVIAMTATDFSIADPNDPHAMDFVGFDANAPAILRDFICD